MILNEKSLKKLDAVCPRLVSVMGAAAIICPIEFQITEGLRSKETQLQYFNAGKSRTLLSKHLKQNDGFSHAVDIVVIIDGKANWDLKNYERVAKYVKVAAQQLDIPVEWGGDWKSIIDGPHFQLKD